MIKVSKSEISPNVFLCFFKIRNYTSWDWCRIIGTCRWICHEILSPSWFIVCIFLQIRPCLFESYHKFIWPEIDRLRYFLLIFLDFWFNNLVFLLLCLSFSLCGLFSHVHFADKNRINFYEIAILYFLMI